MFDGKYSKLLTGLLIAGIAIILIVIICLGFNFIRNYYINNDAKDAVEKFEGEINNTQKNKENSTGANDVAPTIDPEDIVIGNNGSSNTQMYKGFPMVGTIEIPSINLKYPVLQNSSKSAIEVAVALYYGPGLNEIGNTVIVGHNYRNGTFFSNLKKVVEGDKIYIIDLSGNKVTYTVYKLYTTSPEDSSYLDRSTEGKMEVTLLTCTDDSNSRLTVWARAD